MADFVPPRLKDPHAVAGAIQRMQEEKLDKAGVSGTVVLRLAIDAIGRVTAARPLTQPPGNGVTVRHVGVAQHGNPRIAGGGAHVPAMVVDAALEIAREMRFHPALEAGVPVATETHDIAVAFEDRRTSPGNGA